MGSREREKEEGNKNEDRNIKEDIPMFYIHTPGMLLWDIRMLFCLG